MYEPSPKSERSFGTKAKAIGQHFYRSDYFILLMVLLGFVGVAGFVTRGLTARPANMMNILFQSSIRGVASVGQLFVILTAGIDLSVAGVGLVTAIFGAATMTEAIPLNIVGHPISPFIIIPLMLLIGGGLGTVNGLTVSRGGIPPLITTLSMWQIALGIGWLLCGGRSLTELPEFLFPIGIAKVGGVPVMVIGFIAIAAIAYFVLQHTVFGRRLYAVGGNPVSAWLSGVNVQGTILFAYVISGFLSAMAGVMETLRILAASMRVLVGLEMDTIASCVVGGVSLFGGQGNVIGVVIATLIIGVLNNFMSVLGANPSTQGIVKGAIILAAVAINQRRKGRV